MPRCTPTLRWLRRNTAYHRHATWDERTDEFAGYLELARLCSINHPSRITRYQTPTTLETRQSSLAAIQVGASPARRQPCCSPHHQQLCLIEQAYDARIVMIESRAGSAGDSHSRGVDTIGCQQICRRLSRRFPRGDLRVRKKLRRSVLAGMQARDVFRYRRMGEHPVFLRRQAYHELEQQWDNEEVRLLCPPVDLIGAAVRKLTITNAPAVLLIPDWKQQPWHQAEIRIASSDENGESSSRGLGSTTDNQSSLEPPAPRSEPPITRSVRRMELAAVGADGIRHLGGNSAAASRSAELVADYAWSDRTTASRNSQWKAWTQFCERDGPSPLPVTEAHLVSFVGWLALERQAGRRSVGSSSIPQYFTSVRQMQVALIGIPVPHYPFLAHVVRAYEKWQGETYPQPDIRMGIDAPTIQRVWDLCMTSSVPSVLRDAAICVFAYCFNGLRESSVLSLMAENVEISDTNMTVRLSLWKGRRADQLPLVRYHRLSSLPSPLDLWKRWELTRSNHPRFFALAGEPTA